MTTPEANPNDPSGYVSNPPTTIVKIHGTAREDVNGLLGVVVQFNSDRGRYLVHCTSTQAVVAMKPENLIKANYMEQATAQFQQLTKDPQIRRILANAESRLPPGVALKHVGMGVGALLVVLVYLLGFSRVMMLISFLLMGGMLIGPDLAAGADRQTIIRNAPMRFRTMLREQLPSPYGAKVADNNYAVAALALFIVFFFVKSMMPVSKPPTPPASMNMPPTSPTRQLSQSNIEEYYKLGFDDATAQKEYGASLADAVKHSPVNYDDVDLGVPDYPMPPPTGGGGMLNKFFSLSSAMSIMYLGKTAMELGKDATGAWRFDLFKANLSTMEPWKLGLLGLSLYRLVNHLFLS